MKRFSSWKVFLKIKSKTQSTQTLIGSSEQRAGSWVTLREVESLLTRMQSSIGLEGVQWNIPVLSYFISAATKSKSRAWSSAMPTWNLLVLTLSQGLLVGLTGRLERFKLMTEAGKLRMGITMRGGWMVVLCTGACYDNLH